MKRILFCVHNVCNTFHLAQTQMKPPFWYYTDASKHTESDAFEQIIVTSMETVVEDKDVYREALLAEYEDLLHAMKQGNDSLQVRRMLRACKRALAAI